MQTLEFSIHDDYIELVKLLKVTSICMTGGEAKIRIENGEVEVNGELESRKRRKLRPGDVVTLMDYSVTVKAEA